MSFGNDYEPNPDLERQQKNLEAQQEAQRRKLQLQQITALRLRSGSTPVAPMGAGDKQTLG